MAINEEAYQEVREEYEFSATANIQDGSEAWLRDFLESYEAAKSAERPDERSLSQKIDDVQKHLVEQQGDDQFRKLFWRIARILKCLPSCFADDNEHVIEAAQKAMEWEFRPLAEAEQIEAVEQLLSGYWGLSVRYDTAEGGAHQMMVDALATLLKRYDIRRRE